MKLLLALGLAAGLLCTSATPSRAAIAAPVSLTASAAALGAPVILVADGCGPGWYRGPGGACHRFGRGPYPGGYWGPSRFSYGGYYGWNGCPAGFWHGPWGHCRDTPYHGRLPDGGWQ